jgi:hypothetical protein
MWQWMAVSVCVCTCGSKCGSKCGIVCGTVWSSVAVCVAVSVRVAVAVCVTVCLLLWQYVCVAESVCMCSCSSVCLCSSKWQSVCGKRVNVWQFVAVYRCVCSMWGAVLGALLCCFQRSHWLRERPGNGGHACSNAIRPKDSSGRHCASGRRHSLWHDAGIGTRLTRLSTTRKPGFSGAAIGDGYIRAPGTCSRCDRQPREPNRVQFRNKRNMGTKP